MHKYLAYRDDDKDRYENHYNLSIIIAVSFKVNSQKAVRFRVWANQIAKHYTLHGWAIDSERIKSGGTILTGKYFTELLERYHEIRKSDRNFFQKITDLYTTALGYDKSAGLTKDIYYKVLNKMRFKYNDHILGKLMYNDRKQSLELILSAYLDMAENKAKQYIPMTMADWTTQLDICLLASEDTILMDVESIVAKIATSHVESEFEKYHRVQNSQYISDFDEYLEEH